MSKCCEVEKIISLDDADDCTSAADEASEPHEKMILKSLGLFNGEDIVQEKVLEYTDKFEPVWKDTAKDIIGQCVTSAAAIKSKMAEQGHTTKCSPVGGFFLMCLMKETFMQCPADKWQNSEFVPCGARFFHSANVWFSIYFIYS
uniref:Uncharacterized protein n=1 Tax=Anopheles maculatus TaxID=74869 RepID=A0A182SIT6_9DIPT